MNSHPAADSKKQTLQEQVNACRERFIKQGYTAIFTDNLVCAVVFRRVSDDEKTDIAGFSGKKRKPDFLFYSCSPELVNKVNIYIDKWYKKLINNALLKAERKLAKAIKKQTQQTLLAVGDILVASWGYDQTNYDYYQVTRLVGKNSVEIRELCQSTESTSWGEDACVPVKNKFIGEPMIKRVNEKGSVKVRAWGVWASKKKSVKVAGVEIFKPDYRTSSYNCH